MMEQNKKEGKNVMLVCDLCERAIHAHLHLLYYIRSKKWVICTLDNGSITGYGHLYDFIVEERSKAADVLIVHDGELVPELAEHQ